jgi:hypothetical protein
MFKARRIGSFFFRDWPRDVNRIYSRTFFARPVSPRATRRDGEALNNRL